MSLRNWLRERSSAVPPRLSARIDEALGSRRDAPESEAAEHCVDAAAALLGDLLSQKSTGRDSALDLLTVDALVTYAFEAASDDPATLREHAMDAARRFADVSRS